MLPLTNVCSSGDVLVMISGASSLEWCSSTSKAPYVMTVMCAVVRSFEVATMR